MSDNYYKANTQVNLDASDNLGKREVTVTLELEQVGKSWEYTIISEDGSKLLEPLTTVKTPSDLPNRSPVFKGLSSLPNKDTNIEIVREGFKSLVKTIERNIKKAQRQQKKELQKKYSEYIKAGEKVFERFKSLGINVPRYIASLSRWQIAGEEANVIKILLATMNTAKGEATNILSESASASGKTHIEKAGFSLVHDHHHITINFSTTASFRNQASKDPTMFKNKVVRLGDLGNEANQEVLEEVMGIIKILNSEGVYESYKMAKDNETTLHFTLYGRTAMCYSKVANNRKISEQDASRGILYSPNPLNDVDFEEFAMWKNTPDYITNYKEYVDEKVREIQDYMEYLIHSDIEVINPYQKQISEILKKNKAYRRVLTKELWLLKSLALLNLPNKKIYEIKGKKVIFVSVQDVMNYLVLYKPDIIANSNYDMSVHSYRLYEMISKDYEPIAEEEVMSVFMEELENTHSENYDDHKFKESKRFFTINTIVDKYRGTHQLTNIISEVKRPKDKLRYVLQNMIGLIGYTTIPDENYNNRGQKPTLYYLTAEADITSLIDKLVMDKKTLQLISHLGYEELIPDIIEDFMSVNSIDEAEQREDMIIMKFNEKDCDIMEHHPDIKLPPTQYISKETIEYVDKLWNKYFPNARAYRKRKPKGVLV